MANELQSPQTTDVVNFKMSWKSTASNLSCRNKLLNAARKRNNARISANISVNSKEATIYPVRDFVNHQQYNIELSNQNI